MGRSTRDREAHAIIGFKAEGKTTFVRKVADASYDYRTDKVIVICNTVPPALADLSYVDNPEKLRKGWVGIIRYFNPEGYEETVSDIVDLVEQGYIKKGAIFFDDVTKYITANPQEKIKRVLTDHRMRDLDLFFITHALRMLPKFCRAMISTVTMFKTAENFEHPRDVRQLDYSNYEAIYHGWKKVKATPRIPGYIQTHVTVETGV